MAPRRATVTRVFLFALVIAIGHQYGSEVKLLGSQLTTVNFETTHHGVVHNPTQTPTQELTPSPTGPPTDPPKREDQLARHELIFSFYHVNTKNSSIVVSVSFGLSGTFISVPSDVRCCILDRQTFERIHAQTERSVASTECTKLVPLQTFPRSNHEAECTFPIEHKTKEEIDYFENETKWAVVLMDKFEFINDLRKDATMPLMRSPDRPWTTKPLYKFSFSTELRNVENSIDELVAYQFLIGFDHGYVYDDGSTDRTKEILQTYADERLITLGDVGTMATQRQIATITRHRLTHLHETEYIVHHDDDIFFVVLKGKQASPMFAEAAIARLNSKPNVGCLELMSYWFGPSLNILPQKFMTQSFLWKDPWIGLVRDWRGSKQNNRLAVTRVAAIDRAHLTHDYALLPEAKTIFPAANEMYFNHYKFRSKSEYDTRMDSVGMRGSWAWTSLAISNNNKGIAEDIWELGHKKLDIELDPTMLVFGPSLEWLVHAGPKYLKNYAIEERVLLQQHLDRSRPLVHFILPAFAREVDGKPIDTRANYATVSNACALESVLVALNGTHDVWVWNTPVVGSDANTPIVGSHVDEIVTEIIEAVKGIDKTSVKQTSASELFHNTPFEGKKIDDTNAHKLTQIVQLTIAHKYGGLVLDSSVAVHNGTNSTSDGGSGKLSVTDFLGRYKDGYGYVNEAVTSDGGFVVSVEQRRHVAIWVELERLAGVSKSALRAAGSNSLNAFELWPKNVFPEVFVKSGDDSGSLDACGKLTRDGWHLMCPNTVAWVKCKM